MPLLLRRLSFLAVLLILLCHQSELLAQAGAEQPRSLPVPVEFTGGNNRFLLQTLINKRFTPESKFNLLSVTSAASAYRNESANFDFINTSQIGFDLYKGFGVSGGISLNARTGFSPTAGVEYVLATPRLLFVMAPDVFLSNDHNLETISVLEYKPTLANNWSLYTRLQLFYNYNLKQDHHDRSYIAVRAGPAYGRFAFGLGANFDWYGPMRSYKENYGLFVRYSFL